MANVLSAVQNAMKLLMTTLMNDWKYNGDSYYFASSVGAIRFCLQHSY